MNTEQTIPRQPTERDYRDLAFLFAGEGWATVVREKRNKAKNSFASQYIIHVGITMTDEKTMSWLQRTFGKNLIRTKQHNPKWKAAWHWRMYGDEGLELLKNILPHLAPISEKSKVIALLFKFREIQKQSRGLKNGDYREELLNSLYWEIRNANAKGSKTPNAELDAVETERAALETEVKFQSERASDDTRAIPATA